MYLNIMCAGFFSNNERVVHYLKVLIWCKIIIRVLTFKERISLHSLLILFSMQRYFLPFPPPSRRYASIKLSGEIFLAAALIVLCAQVNASASIEGKCSATDIGAVRARILLVRHGDKMSKYPPCEESSKSLDNDLCYDIDAYGNNPALSPCGRAQARRVAQTIDAKDGPIVEVVSSPYLRALQTALPLSQKTGIPIQVEPLVSEDRQLTDPYRAHNAHHASSDAARDLEDLSRAWDRTFSSPPIPTPENNEEYWTRASDAAAALRSRALRVASSNINGTIVVFSHAGPSFSFAYGLCKNLYDDVLEDFVRSFVIGEDVPLDGLAPTGIIRAAFDDRGKCIALERPDNGAWMSLDACGKTKPHQKSYAADPGKYWKPPQSDAEKLYVDRTGD